MATVEPVKVINVDGKQYLVEALDDEVKQLVNLFNTWNQKEANATDEIVLYRAAKNDVSGRIILKIRESEAAAAAAAEAPPAPAPAPAPVAPYPPGHREAGAANEE